MPLPITDAIDIAIQIAEGLAAAHEKGIVHRDIKPANIFVCADSRVKILDFGIAKLAGGRTRLTQTGLTVGTVAYMSPEQAMGKEVDCRTDIWSLGVVLYEMLAGNLPFSGDFDQAVIYTILNEHPEPLKSLRLDVPAELAQVVEKSLQKDPEKRFRNIGEMLSEFSSIKKMLDKDVLHPETKRILPSIAVLPFTNMSPDPENEYFSDGLAEELINALSKLEGLHVTARTSASRFRGKDLDIREIGKQLNVGSVLEGSVRKMGNRLRITVQLINTADGYHLWSERYDRELEDVFAIQDEISLAIVDKLKVRLLGEEKTRLAKHYTNDFEIYDLYLKGRYYLNTFTEEGVTKSLEYFRLAIQKDPRYALAYGGVASIYFWIAVMGQLPANETMPKAKSELLKAIELDDSIAELHAWLGDLYLQYEWDWASAERELKRAIELKPNSPEAHQFYSDYLSATGHVEEAVAEAQRARDLDPLSTITYTILIWQLFVSGQFKRVIEHCRNALQTGSSFLIQFHLWRALRRENRLSEALAECKVFVSLFVSREIIEAMDLGYAKSGFKGAMRAIALKLVEQSKIRYVTPYMIAMFYALAEDDDQTLQWLERAYEERDQRFYSIGVEPDWDRVRMHPRFNALLKKIGLVK